MEKKAQAEILETLTLFELLAGFAVATFLIFAALGYNNFTSFGKEYLKADLKMVHQAALAAPAEVTVRYPVSSSFSIEANENDIKVGSSNSLGLGSYYNHTIQSNGVLKRQGGSQ